MAQISLEQRAQEAKIFDDWDEIYLLCPNFSLLEADTLEGMLETAQTGNQFGILIAYLNTIIKLYSDPSYTLCKDPDYPIERVKEIRNMAKQRLNNC